MHCCEQPVSTCILTSLHRRSCLNGGQIAILIGLALPPSRRTLSSVSIRVTRDVHVVPRVSHHPTHQSMRSASIGSTLVSQNRKYCSLCQPCFHLYSSSPNSSALLHYPQIIAQLGIAFDACSYCQQRFRSNYISSSRRVSIMTLLRKTIVCLSSWRRRRRSNSYL
jgi:hypothetical protein